MKILIIIILSFISISTNAQYYQYPKTGMVQSVRYSGNIYDAPGDLSFAYFGDTVLCSNTYSQYCALTTGGTASCGIGMYGTLTRMSGSKIYIVYGPCDSIITENLWYDWGLNVGDYISVYPGNLNGSIAVVDSVYMKTMLNGQLRKYIRLHGSSWISGNVVYRWVEGIGDIDRGFFANSDFEGGQDIFVCHQENDTLIWNNPNLSLYCHYQTVTGITKNIKNGFDVYPNPTFSIINITDEQNQFQNATIKIKNYLGQVVFTSPFNSQINLSNLFSGMYFLTLEDKENKKTVKIVKE